MLLNRVCSQISKIRPPPKVIPRRRPPGIPSLQYSARKSGVCAGEGLGGGGPRGTGLSLRGGSLQGLSQRHLSLPPGASAAFSAGKLPGAGISMVPKYFWDCFYNLDGLHKKEKKVGRIGRMQKNQKTGVLIVAFERCVHTI